jgi:7,8-dihydropterin-6-yl-methyl-4-(beta-D-ribofuranosyl)aminobenzene 5'-phosphate synthase
MTLRVLVDNNTYIDQYYLGEPAVCFVIEDEGNTILFDTGYSEIFLSNAEKMVVDLGLVDTIVFSHGHNDHTAGFQYLVKKVDTSEIEVVAHPLCFNPKKDGEELIGAPFDEDEMNQLCKLRLSKEPIKISKNITYLGEIPCSNEFEKRVKIGLYKSDNAWVDDYVMDDTAIVYQNTEGLFIITGCSHSGICNIIEYAKKVCYDNRVIGVIGGFHLFDKNELLEETITYFKNNKIQTLYPCHCVSFQVKSRLNEVLNLEEVGVSLTLNF